MRVERYDTSNKELWDQFVRSSKNGTFLFFRDYMEYHQETFPDHSLLVWSDDGVLTAMLPATKRDDVLGSHTGLTYGGFITSSEMTLPKMVQLFDDVIQYLRQNGFRQLVYKTIPHVYHRVPAEEDRYALFLCAGQLVRRAVLTVVDYRERLPLQTRRHRGAKKAAQSGITVRESNDLAAYWNILTERLLQALGAGPAHSLAEIESLRARFPGNIRLFGAFQEGTLIAGVLVYESEHVARAQYIAGDERSRRLGALDLIFTDLLERYASKRFFEFGSSDRSDGRVVSRGLVEQKEGYGGRTVVQ